MIPAGESWQAVGKRKNAIARVTLTPGSGKFYIRKWRKLPIAEGQTVTYVNRDGQEVTEDMNVCIIKGIVRFSSRRHATRLGFGRQNIRIVVRTTLARRTGGVTFVVSDGWPDDGVL